jgi:LytR cell envelope-related transcriptional attenuator
VGNLTISDTLTKGDLFRMAEEFKGLPASHLVTQTLPTTEFVTDGGADVLLAAQPYADQQIAAFNLIGLPKPSPSATTTTTAPPLANSAVSVNVQNASGGGQLASQTASGLEQDGFAVTGVNNAPSVIASGDPSEIFYGPSGLPAAHTLADSLKGTVTYVGSPLLTGNNLMLWVANPGLTVDTTTTTTTTTPGSSTTPTAPPGNVVTNTQPEPWNPVPCTLGAPATTTTTVVTAKGSAAKSAARPAPKPTAKSAAQSG